jgi:hypothetical protein
MNDYIFFMHNDAPTSSEAGWQEYFAKLRDSGCFSGGSAIGEGACFKKNGSSPPIASQLTGYIRIKAASMAEAQRFLDGNPVYEAGGTVEIRALPRD